MTPNKTHIRKFFKGSEQYTIPVYQRAYSWVEKHWNAFLEDLKEATKATQKENHYFFGNVLLEKNPSNNEVSDIIDGQQRITTIIIFVRALCNVLTLRAQNGEILKDNTSNEEFIKSIKEVYLIYGGKPKLEAVEYDSVYFRKLIIENNENFREPETPSQKRIKNAKKYFEEELDKANKDKSKVFSTKELLDMFKVVEDAELLETEFDNPKDSVLMFELQNNRGERLTNMEKLKSYFAYQIYIYSNNVSSQLKVMTDMFKEIYRKINKLERYGIDEDSILNYFNISKFGFSYRENDDTKNYKREFKKIPNDEKINWIDKYVTELQNAFCDFENFQTLDSVYKERLDNLNVWQIYPFIIKAYTLFRGKIDKLEKVFGALEIIAFRHALIRTRGDLPSKLNSVLMDFNSIENLTNGLADICSNEKAHWKDQKVKDSLKQIFITNWGIVLYILERYENHLRSRETITKGQLFTLGDISNPQREHIAPQTEKDEEIASGYCEYDDEFKESYLHCIGNLALISQPQNGHNGNKPFAEKLESYKEQGLLRQLTEIENFASKDDNGRWRWDKEAIDKRHEELEKFVLKTWSFK